MIGTEPLFIGLFLVAMSAAALSDVATRTIPNALTAALAAAFPPAALAAGLGESDALLHAGGAALVLGGGFTLFAAGWLGGGDVKLAAAAALWLGPTWTPAFLVGTMLAGGALALLTLALRVGFGASGPFLVRKLADPGEGVPYGVALAASAAFVAIRSPLLGSGV